MTSENIVTTFPFNEVPSVVTDTRERRWISELAGLSVVDVTATLEERWRRAESYGFSQLASLMRSGRVESLLISRGIAYLTLFLRAELISVQRAPGLAGHVIETRMYLRRVCDASEFQQKLNGFNLEQPVLIDVANFLQIFGGLRESEPPHAGGFVFATDVASIGWIHNQADCTRCENSYLSFFDSCGGDLLAVYPDGRTAWCCIEDWFQNGPVRPVAQSVRRTVSRYATFRANEFRPFHGDTYWEDAWSQRERSKAPKPGKPPE